VRPWQHVLALVHGYLALASRLIGGDATFAEAWNFGPRDGDAVPVHDLVDRLGKVWRRPEINYLKGTFPETHFLHLDSTKARSQLGWQPPLDFADAVALTAEWYREFYARPSSAQELTAAQIKRYRERLSQEPQLLPETRHHASENFS
jgi:CDP-glucose 4,6-dehydratase